MTPVREPNDWVVIKLSEPRRERGPPAGSGGGGGDTTLQSERGCRGRGIDVKHGRASRMIWRIWKIDRQ